jgi:hypothetical protein
MEEFKPTQFIILLYCILMSGGFFPAASGLQITLAAAADI